ncbi:DUF3142 domain-containing protein [Klebsiella variicola]|uniref:DUF3142 domain-containing protein n=1 Tax=Klebsiella variicola TaxID=244366 RepID=UPI000906F575|nr:DUF3142 domain-containing protein [Klebsiella variicola]
MTSIKPRYGKARRCFPPCAFWGSSFILRKASAWPASQDLRPLLSAADSSVLQLHSVQSPGTCLFAPTQAQRWSRQYALIALPPFAWRSLPMVPRSSLPRESPPASKASRRCGLRLKNKN